MAGCGGIPHRRKKTQASLGFHNYACRLLLKAGYIIRLQTFLPFVYFELYFLPFGQGSVPFAADIAVVNKDIVRRFSTRDESVPACIVKPFDRT